ncbi:Transposon TX1 uncharacterized protein [Nymphaea thermarum]|nr:Transposon TX1 uncharacterized protein [Nymphaea thermarum]
MKTPMASDEEFPPLQGPVSSPCGKGEIQVRDSPPSSSPGDPTDQGHGIRSWASLLSGGPLVGSQPEHPLEVEIQDGKFKIFIPKEAYDEMNRPFQWAALARLQGSSPNGRTNFSFVFQELTRQWAGKAHPKFTILAGGTFLIRVEDEQQLHCITQKQAWRVGGRTLVTCRWQPGQSLNMPPATSAPLWIRLPNLPPNMWTAQIFNSIAKGLQGELLEIDTQTRDINRGGFARIRVELPLNAPLPPEFQFVLKDSHTLAQPLVYEGRLRFCRFCGVNSHPPDKCPRCDFHGQGNLQHKAVKGKESFKVASSSKGPIAPGQKNVPTSKNQFSALMDLDESQEVEPTRSPSTTNDAKPLEDKTNEVRGITHSRGRGSRLSGHRKFAQDTSNRSFANPDPAGPAGKRKRISLDRVDALADTSPPSQTSDFPTAVGEGSVSDQHENIDSFFIFDTLINADRLHINSSFLGSYATMTNADMCDGVVRILCGWKPQRYSVVALNLHRKELQASLEDEDSLWRQRARVKWMAEGDRNTAFYQAIVKGRRTKNSLCALEHEGTRINDVNHIRSICADYFCDLLGSQEGSGCCLTKKDDGPRLLDEDNATLLLPATLDEVKRVVFSMDENSAPGPDGFPASFYQQHWSVVGHDLLQVINSFLSTGRLVKKVNRNYIALIPKKEGLCRVDDLRPIALCNVLYKIISKFLSYRMKRCLQKVISKDQGAFLPGRSITENIIFAHECIHSLEGLRQSNICFKIDFSKAYDRVSWVFLKNALLDLGFSLAWVDRVMMCVSSPSFAVLIDGIPGDFHPMHRGLRQGDSMSPYLFLVVMEELSRNLEFRRWNGSLIPPYIPRVGACPSLLAEGQDDGSANGGDDEGDEHYYDDGERCSLGVASAQLVSHSNTDKKASVLSELKEKMENEEIDRLKCETARESKLPCSSVEPRRDHEDPSRYRDRHSYNEVMHALDALKLSSGLCVNPHKSHVISLGEQSAPLSFINSDWQQGSLPLPYLGTPLFAGNMQDNLCAPLVLKVEKKLSLWSSKLLSYAGRLCLIRYVLFSLVGYWCSVFMLPKTIQHKLEATMANFLWGSLETRKGVHLVAWKTICRPVLEGGVGLKRLDEWNKACIGRITLRLCQDDAPWANFIKKKYLSFHSLWTLKRPKKESWFFKGVRKSWNQIQEHVRWSIDNGSIRFWTDNWGGSPLISHLTPLERSAFEFSLKFSIKQVLDSDLPILDNFKDFLFRLGMERPNLELHQDLILWQNSSASNIKIFDVWEVVRKKYEEEPWRRLIWFPQAHPRAQWDSVDDKKDLQVWLATGIIPDKSPPFIDRSSLSTSCLYNS